MLALSVPLRELEIRFVRTLGVHIESIRLEHTLTIAALESNNSISDANQMISPSFVYRELARSREMRSEASINHPERTFFAKTPSIVLQDLNEYWAEALSIFQHDKRVCVCVCLHGDKSQCCEGEEEKPLKCRAMKITLRKSIKRFSLLFLSSTSPLFSTRIYSFSSLFCCGVCRTLFFSFSYFPCCWHECATEEEIRSI